jgi:hypothetical protein
MNYNKIKYYFDAGLWNAPMVKVAVKKGVISPIQYKEITGLDYEGGGNTPSTIEEKAAAYDILTGGLQ